MQKLILYLFIILSLGHTKDIQYVLLISFDGFRYDYMDWVDTPNFDYIQKKGVKATSLQPVFPSLTFPNHYSIATGSYSDKHNITGNVFFDKKLDKTYSLYDKQSVRNPLFYKGEPIWVTAERHGLNSASYFWVGTEAPIKGVSPSIFKYYDGSISFETRIDSIISWFELDIKRRPQLSLLYFSEPDYTGHKYGIDKEKIISSVVYLDSLLGYLLKKINTLEIRNNLNIIITSDHGMADVSSEKLLVLNEYINISKEIQIMGDGPFVQINYKGSKNKQFMSIYEDLKRIPHSKAWIRSEIPKRFNFVNENSGDFLLLANEGWFITTKEDLIKKEFTLGGMHGYDPVLANMHGIFYAMGPQIKQNIKIKTFENIHIYPLICELLDILPYDNGIYQPDGELEVLKPILDIRE